MINKFKAWSYKKGANEIAVLFDPTRFASLLKAAYPSLEKEVLNHLLGSEEPILFLPIAGYVMDTGGPSFSRPDKGLVGLMRTVFGKKHIFSRRIVLLYNQLVSDNWKNQISLCSKITGDYLSIWVKDIIICHFFYNCIRIMGVDLLF